MQQCVEVRVLSWASSPLFFMAFYIYDPKGYRHPYHPDWREVDKVEKITSSTEKNSQRFDHFAELIKGIKDTPRWKLTSQKEHSILAHQIMTKNVLTLTPETSMYDAWKFFCKHRFRHVPILNESDLLVGILSDRKLLEESSLIVHPSNHASEHCIHEVMVSNVLTASPETDLRVIAEIMINERVGSMPILNDLGNLVGIITRADILRTIIKIQDDYFTV